MKLHSKKLMLICLFLVFLSFNSNAQAPGYMGKRINMGYSISGSPRIKKSSGGIGINLLHEGYIEYVTKRKWSIGLSAKFYKTVVYNGYRNINISSYNYFRPTSYSPTAYIDIRGTNFTCYFKYFKKNFLAPWGKYFIIGPTLSVFKASYDPNLMYISGDYIGINSLNKNNYFADFGPTEQTYFRSDLMFGNGRSRIIANRIIIDYGYTFNLLAWLSTPFFDDSDLLGLQINQKLTNFNYIEIVSAERVRGYNKFNLFLKIGLLL